ncbi:MAG: peptide ABC transporter substrate-binding protein [Planctomycetota bacterium]
MSQAKSPLARQLAAAALLLGLLAVSVRVAGSARLERADFVFNNGDEVQSLDPATVTGVPEGRIIRGLYEGLCSKDPYTLEPIPGSAESWTKSPDGRVWTFDMRDGARWSNGDPLTADDFEFTFRRFLSPEVAAEYSYLLWGVVNAQAFCTGKTKAGEERDVDWSEVGIRALDSDTLRIELEDPSPYFLEVMAFYPLYPVNRRALEASQAEFPDTWQVEWLKPGKLVSNGPFMLEERRINDRIRMRKNPNYWDADNVALETIDALPISHWGTSVNMYLTGEVDWVDGSIPPNLVPELLKREDFVPKPYLGSYFYRVNVTKPPFDDVRIRRALSLVIPRREIVANVTKAGQEAAWTIIPWTEVDPDQPPVEGEAAAEEARRLFAEAGYGPGGKPFPVFEILYNTSETHRDVAEVIAAAWQRELGVDARLKNQEWKVYLDSQTNLEYDVSRSAWIGDWVDPGPLNFLSLFMEGGANNKTGWGNDEFDELIAAILVEQDVARRDELMVQAEAVLMSEYPVLPIYSYVTQNLIKPRVGGLYGNLLNEHFPKFWYWMDDDELAKRRAALPAELQSVPSGGPDAGKYAPVGRALQIGRIPE